MLCSVFLAARANKPAGRPNHDFDLVEQGQKPIADKGQTVAEGRIEEGRLPTSAM
jgi:hypothetical protein